VLTSSAAGKLAIKSLSAAVAAKGRIAVESSRRGRTERREQKRGSSIAECSFLNLKIKQPFIE